MDYQIKTFAELTGVSERTLRYYHERGLLGPTVASNGYRTYSSQDADRLQLILMYRQLQFSLAEIQRCWRYHRPASGTLSKSAGTTG